jgi:hypothetical protein
MPKWVQVARLEARVSALSQYAKHDSDCPARTKSITDAMRTDGNILKGPCKCGLDELINGVL